MDTSEPEKSEPPWVPVEGGSYWAQWEYTLEEWRLFDQRDWERAVRSCVSSLWDVARFYVSLVAISTLFLTITGLISPTSPLMFGIRVLGAAIGLLVLVLIYGMIDALQLFNAWKRHLARRKGPRQVIIGSLSPSGNQAIWVGKQSVSLQNTFLRLYLALLYEDSSHDRDENSYQPELDFSRFLGPLNIASINMICVPVPRGHEEEARRLVGHATNKKALCMW